jgi:hypothetical protein
MGNLEYLQRQELCKKPYVSRLSSLCRCIIIIFGISFMQGIYTYIPETNHVPREHCVATILV